MAHPVPSAPGRRTNAPLPSAIGAHVAPAQHSAPASLPTVEEISAGGVVVDTSDGELRVAIIARLNRGGGWNGACRRAIRRARKTTRKPPSARLPRKPASKARSWHRWAASTTGSPSAGTASTRPCTTICCAPRAANSPSRTIRTRKPWTSRGFPSRSWRASSPFPMNAASRIWPGKSSRNTSEATRAADHGHG